MRTSKDGDEVINVIMKWDYNKAILFANPRSKYYIWQLDFDSSFYYIILKYGIKFPWVHNIFQTLISKISIRKLLLPQVL